MRGGRFLISHSCRCAYGRSRWRFHRSNSLKARWVLPHAFDLQAGMRIMRAPLRIRLCACALHEPAVEPLDAVEGLRLPLVVCLQIVAEKHQAFQHLAVETALYRAGLAG